MNKGWFKEMGLLKKRRRRPVTYHHKVKGTNLIIHLTRAGLKEVYGKGQPNR